MVRRINPNHRVDVEKLRESINWSLGVLKDHRETYMRILRQYVGKHYGKNGANDKVPVNMIRMALDIYARQLASRVPSVLARTQDSSLRSEARELEIATNHTLREIKFGSSLSEVVKDALMMMGVMKVGITESKLEDAEGILHDAGQPFADPVNFTDFAYDMSATRFESVDWCGNKYQLPYETVKESGLFNKKAIRDIQPSEHEYGSEEGFYTSEHANDLSEGESMIKNKYRKMVALWDIWLPFDRLVVTIAADQKGENTPLRVVEWDGPERGPYHLLTFSDVPGNIMPTSPAAHILDLHELMNRLFRKLGRQAERQKTVTLADATAAQDGSANRLAQTEDGQMIRSDNPEAVKEMRYGGADPVNLAFVTQLRQLLSWAGGNLDVLGGLSQQAETLGQERLLRSSSSEFTRDMQDRTVLFTDNVVEDVSFYQYTNPVLDLSLTKKVPGTSYEVPFRWNPDRRNADFFKYHLNIEPYSLAPLTPIDRLNMMQGIVQNTILPLLPLLQQQGINFNIDEYLRYVAKFSDMEELQDLITINGRPMQINDGGPERPRQSPVTTRNNVRENVSTGGTQNSREAGIIQNLLSGTNNLNQDQQQQAFQFS